MSKSEAAKTPPATDRKAVKEFFAFQVNSDDLKPRTLKLGGPIVFALLIASVTWGFAGQTAGLVAGIATLAGIIALDRLGASGDVARRKKKKDENHAEFARLATETKRVQSNDLLKALLRVFERTMIDRASLRVLEQRFVFDRERDMFDEETLEQKLGDLMNKSIRMISRGDYTNPRLRTVRWLDTRKQEVFYNPTRLVALFLTETQLVICDVQIDSIDGDLKEDIQRIALPKVVNIQFTAERKRLPLTSDQLVSMARDLGYPEDEVKTMKEEFAKQDAQPDQGDWVHEEMTSSLRVSRTDGGSLSVPIRSETFFGRHRSALDADTTLSQNEVTVDRMVNELNRLVERAGPGAVAG
jgi:hypothetical protein